MTHQIVRGRFRAIAPGIAAVAVAVLIAAGQIAFAPSADATEPERSGPASGDACNSIGQTHRVVATERSGDKVYRTIERTTRYRCVDASSADGATYTYTTRTRWTEDHNVARAGDDNARD